MTKAQLAAALLCGAAAGAAPSILAGDKKSELRFSTVSITARGLSDGGTLYQTSACAQVYKDGARTSERVCADRYAPDAGEFSSVIGGALHMAKEKYDAQPKK